MIIQAISVLTILFIGLLVPVYADSPLAQYNAGIPIYRIQCFDEKVLVQSTSGKPYCMSESTAVKLSDRGFSLVSQQAREDYLHSLNFGLVGEGEFEGELYGHDQNVHRRQPAPYLHSEVFEDEHYELSETDLVGKNNLDDIIAIPSSVTGSSGSAIDYREWLPTYVAQGYYLKWIDIVQPENQVVATNEGQGRIKLTYVPKGVEISDDINNIEFSDTSFYLVSAIVSHESKIHTYTTSQIDEITRGGAATDIIFEDRWDGYVKYVYASRSDPTKHGMAYETPYIGISSGGTALTMDEHEIIVTELFERYSN